jgi:hypothetical protein
MMSITEPIELQLSGASKAHGSELKLVSEHLQDRFTDCASNTEIEAAVTRAARRFDGARIRAFIPILVEHAARVTLLHQRHPQRRRALSSVPRCANPPLPTGQTRTAAEERSDKRPNIIIAITTAVCAAIFIAVLTRWGVMT